MLEFAEAFKLALNLVLSFDSNLLEIVFLSLKVSLIALVIACIIGFSLGSLLASNKFFGRGFILILINSFMALPPVVVGLVVYMLLSKSGKGNAKMVLTSTNNFSLVSFNEIYLLLVDGPSFERFL